MKTLFDETRGIKGRIKDRFCEHGKWVIEDYIETDACRLCSREEVEVFSIPNTTPFFNHGLGCVTRGTRDSERIAKRMGRIPIGREPVKGIQ